MNREQITQHHCDLNSSKFDCAECDKKFTVLQHFNRHLLLIHGVRLFVWCPSCRSYFARIDALKKHQSRCHQSDSINSQLLGSSTSVNRNESARSLSNISSITTSTITSASKNRNLLANNGIDRISTVISHQQPQTNLMNGQITINTTSGLRRDENHFMSNTTSTNLNKPTSIINLNSNNLNNNLNTSMINNQNNIDENLFRTQTTLPTTAAVFANTLTNNLGNLALVRNSVISRGSASNNMMMMEEQLQSTLNDNANRIKLLNGNIMLSNNKVQQYIGTGGTNNVTNTNNNEREADNNSNNLHNQLSFEIEAMRDDYNYLYRNKKIRFGELIEKDRIFKQ